MFQKRRKYDPLYYLNKRARELIKMGFLERQGISVVLTSKGMRYLQKIRLRDENLKKKKWDGKWRVLVFDVWEKSRRKRDQLRREIKEFGFVQLQQSVWIYPFECGVFIELLRTELQFGRNIRYMVVERLDDDERLRARFGVK